MSFSKELTRLAVAFAEASENRQPREVVNCSLLELDGLDFFLDSCELIRSCLSGNPARVIGFSLVVFFVGDMARRREKGTNGMA